MNNVTARTSHRIGHLQHRERAARAAARMSSTDTARQVNQELAQLFYWMRKRLDARSAND